MAGTDRVAGEADARRPRSAGRPRPARGPFWAEVCWVGILLAAGSFQIGRGAPIEGGPFVLAALALIADHLGWLARFDGPVRVLPTPRWLRVLVTTLSAVVIGATPAFGWAAGLLVAAAGVAAVAPTWGRREPPDPSDAAEGPGIRRSAIAWGAVAVALCLWELASFFAGLPSAHADWEHPALSDLVKPAVELPLLRAVLFAAWLAVGWALVRRGTGTGTGTGTGDDHREQRGGAAS